MASQAQLDTIGASAVSSVARDMAQYGVTLTHEQADQVGDEGVDWLRTRLGLTVTTTDRHVRCDPPNSFARDRADVDEIADR